MQEAVRILDGMRVDFEYDGEMSADVALNRELMASQYPFCRLTGPANVLVMPAFHSASISTRMLQELGGATVLGPLLVGRSARRTPTSSTWRRWRGSTSGGEKRVRSPLERCSESYPRVLILRGWPVMEVGDLGRV